MAPILGLLQYMEIQIYNEKASFLIACFLGEDLELWAMSPWRGLLATCHKFYLYTFT